MKKELRKIDRKLERIHLKVLQEYVGKGEPITRESLNITRKAIFFAKEILSEVINSKNARREYNFQIDLLKQGIFDYSLDNLKKKYRINSIKQVKTRILTYKILSHYFPAIMR